MGWDWHWDRAGTGTELTLGTGGRGRVLGALGGGSVGVRGTAPLPVLFPEPAGCSLGTAVGAGARSRLRCDLGRGDWAGGAVNRHCRRHQQIVTTVSHYLPHPGVTEGIAASSLHLLNLFVFSSGTDIFLCI